MLQPFTKRPSSGTVSEMFVLLNDTSLASPEMASLK